MRVLGVDFGGKRIGIALGETDQGIATPRKVLAASGSLVTDAKAISQIARDEEAEVIVLGVPINLPGGSDRMERICLQLSEHIKEEGWRVYLVDEALSSLESEKHFSSVYKPGAKQKNLDGEAARLILERFFNGQS